MEIRKVAVLGAGVMGASIAAHVANAGVPVILLDIVPQGAGDRSAIAKGAVDKLLKAEPAAFMLPEYAKLVTPGNIEDHLDLVREADWIIEAVVEKAEIKQELYRKIVPLKKKDAAVSSNTSSIPLAQLSTGLPESFRRSFLITHFFNPPRYMRLLELVAGTETRPEILDSIRDFADIRLGKGTVNCKDTPGFIANRIGIYWLQCAVTEAVESGLTVEEADAVLGPVAGIPKTGVFGLLDLVGLDLMPHIIDSMKAGLPPGDAFQAIAKIPGIVKKLLAQGYTGRKGKGGFYRLSKEGGHKVKEAVDLATGEFRLSVKPHLESVAAAKRGGLRALIESDDPTGRYAWRVLSRTLAYAASLVPEIADDIVAVDQAMKLGYNWEHGPLELIDRIGVPWFAAKLKSEGMPVPALLESVDRFYRIEQGRLHHLTVDKAYQPVKRPHGVLLLSDVKLQGAPLARNGSASLWDLGDGVLCLEFHSKMNTLDPQIMEMIGKALEIAGKEHKALVIHNEAANFSAGANLGILLFTINIAAWGEVENLLRQGQEIYKRLKYAPFPVVAAPSGMALGGGCEILLHCDAVQAHAELYAGLVEVGVGLIPGWGGCKELLHRWQTASGSPGGPMPAIAKAFEIIGTAQVSKSAAEAKKRLFLQPTDGITMNRDRLLADAKAKALELCRDYAPPKPPEYRLPGASAKAALAMALRVYRQQGKATAYDEVVSMQLAEVLCGGSADITEALSEDDVLSLERKAFLELAPQAGTLARLDHMMETGKPLRN